ncbi:unnamed protein product [Brachionus calyciflorus]|uniref:Uncharacterized protein n=1 Tax=Brachionus calyciflorus TaxID=104777 RepID=A0A814P0X6_9BILA|nr:unnamed protein product [Brachionus calyciflorus]
MHLHCLVLHFPVQSHSTSISLIALAIFPANAAAALMLIISSLQNDINVLVDWCKECKKSTELNVSKCKSIYIGKNREKKEYRITSHLGETTVLSETTCGKDLGVIITND